MNTGLRINGVVCENATIVDRRHFGGMLYVQVELSDGRLRWYLASVVVRYAHHPVLVSDRHAELVAKFGGRGR